MNQRYRQKATNSVEKDFSKLLNNANFGYDCINYLGNSIFELICDEFSTVTTTYLINLYPFFLILR